MEAHAEYLVGKINPEHFDRYLGLLSGVPTSTGDAAYRREYRSYWAMNAARLGPGFYEVYFSELARDEVRPLDELLLELRAAIEDEGGRPSLQFSFSTKLLHMRDPHLPIYDAQVSAFYGLAWPDSGRALPKRVGTLVEHHDFLSREYARVLDEGLLAKCLAIARSEFPDERLTDERMIDSLIWRFMSLLWGGAVARHEIV
jgi:hypothetical protein